MIARIIRCCSGERSQSTTKASPKRSLVGLKRRNPASDGPSTQIDQLDHAARSSKPVEIMGRIAGSCRQIERLRDGDDQPQGRDILTVELPQQEIGQLALTQMLGLEAERQVINPDRAPVPLAQGREPLCQSRLDQNHPFIGIEEGCELRSGQQAEFGVPQPRLQFDPDHGAGIGA
ncbi:hypothetical protein QWZ10_19180 [Paracoccus cavernae]|uniref:Uncharacterized protein n=1 Tax=Paracoccus cavernae TaxID=1571207 RepID=A0ABT8D968_9RHOB|nr:hypothetical protein [Paracoccus cavernae]